MIDFPKLEENILEFWKKNKIFEKSLERRKGAKRFVFYEGPPFANARPGIHHVLARSFKDIIARYKTMRGYYVPRKAGWDTHGLPVEMEVEKKLGISSKPEIEEIGVGKFIEKCQENILTYKEQWEEMTERMGYWIDLKNAYITCSNEYIESVWWVFKQIWEKGLVYQDYKVVPYCPRCGTSLSDHEVAQGYRETKDPSIYIKFALKSKFLNHKSSLLVWTTTPWTLPANVALAINPKVKYAQIKVDNEILILAKERMGILNKKGEVLNEFDGKMLICQRYKPLFEENGKEQKRVVGADFVSLEEGTGVVHIAPAFGAEDMDLAKKENLPVILNVNEEGKFKEEVKKWSGKFVKEADDEIIYDLEKRNLLYKKETIVHSYPFCWRCETPLLYYAKNSWYIKTTAVKSQMLDNNEKINWIPSYIKYGRFGNWLKENIDWTISRERYWGTPLPIWQCQCGNIKVVGSVKELKVKKINLHRPFIDKVLLECEKCGGKMRRVPEVLDCWFDSGSMPFASWHYPFENIEQFKQNFPADFIAEGIDQTRGWFYTLLAISTLLGLGPAYKNVISLGLVLDEKGQKMSKSKGNVVLPDKIFAKYGADAIRLYFYLTPLGETTRFIEKDLAEVFRKFIITFYNSFIFYQTYAPTNLKSQNQVFKPENVLDKWILSKLNLLIKELTEELEQYNITNAARLLYEFVINDLSNWYIRRSRKRQSSNFFQTLGMVLLDVAKISAPFVPFIAEEVYQKINFDKENKFESVHLSDWPKSNKGLIDRQLNNEMEAARKICELGLAIRAEKKIKVRQPLSEVSIEGLSLQKEILELIGDELNVKKVKLGKVVGLGKDWAIKEEDGLKVALNVKITSQLKQEGYAREIVRHIQEKRKQAGFKPLDVASIYWQADDKELLDVIKIFRKKIEKETKTILKQKSGELKDKGQEIIIEGKKIYILI